MSLRRMLLAQDAATPPIENKPIYVEWIGSDSTAYIDTGVYSQKDLEVYCKGSYSKFVLYGGLYGDYQDEQHNVTRVILVNLNQGYSSCRRVPVCGTVFGFSANKIHSTYNTWENITVDGVVINNSVQNDGYNVFPNRTIKILNANITKVRDIGARVYDFKLYLKGGKLLKHFRPCLHPVSKEPCMYEEVEGKYYYNAGKGLFTHGEIIN